MADITDQILHELGKRLKRDVDMKAFTAKLQQTRVASTLGKQRRAMEGLGRVRMEINSDTYHYWGKRLGYECWRDEQFLREMERDNPEIRVQCGGTGKLQVGYTPSASRSRFHKSYAPAQAV